MKSRHAPVVICISFLAVSFLYGFATNVQGEEGKTTIKKEYPEEKVEFRNKAKEKLAEFDKKIAELESKTREAGVKTKADANKGLQELKDKRAALKYDMEELEASSKNTWESAKQKANEAMDDLERTYNKVRSYFK